ncbi:hypothetical protein MA16_Dca000233 [Dendrobium catenatum]|uniref:Uncharacterized protein n=1 Tax=Dendrobium catenatum TaxID=906689 RepID=A0A2I0WT99_9ASPA|nr:hypothetical protein MA16_Dca000233 [Dendrobium catenatum]
MDNGRIDQRQSHENARLSLHSFKKRWKHESSVSNGIIQAKELDAEEKEEWDLDASNEEGGGICNVMMGSGDSRLAVDCLMDHYKMRGSLDINVLYKMFCYLCLPFLFVLCFL